ncbi:hypothetical protein ABPG72_010063 [Tetrahymena utriculariae]
MSDSTPKQDQTKDSSTKNNLKHSLHNMQKYELDDTPLLIHDLNKPWAFNQQTNMAVQGGYTDLSQPIRTDDGINYEVNIEGITEEELDDWIAQSANRPISSYLDPYKKFSAPASLLSQLKRRYRQKFKIGDPNCKRLYFSSQDEKISQSRLYSLQNQSQGQGLSSDLKQSDLNLTFNYNNLSPKKISGTSIRVREKKIGNLTPLNNASNSNSNNLSSFKNPYGEPHDNLQSYSAKINSYLNAGNVEKYGTPNTYLKQKQHISISSSANKRYESESKQNSMNMYDSPQMHMYDPDKDINFNKYDKKQIQVIKDLQNRFRYNGSVNSSIRPSFKSNANRHQQIFMNNNLLKLRGQSAQAYNRSNLFTQVQSPQKIQKMSLNNGRPSSVMKRHFKQSINKTLDGNQIQRYQSFSGEYEQNQENSYLYNNLKQKSAASPYSQNNFENSLNKPNPFTAGKEQFKNSYIQICGQKNITTNPFEINLQFAQNQSNQRTDQDNLQNPFAIQQHNQNENNQNKDQVTQKIPSFRQNLNKKNVKEEQVDKDVIKKVIEKVEKLLAEKEEKLPSELEQKNSGNDRLALQNEKQDESSLEQNFNQHLNEISEVSKSKSQQDSAQASFLKGVGRMKKNKDRSAITAFKQALNFDKAHFPTIYNLACIYERNKKFKCAESWLEIANMFKKNKNDINYGFAIIYYKTQRFEEAYKKIDLLIEELAKNLEEEETIPQTHLYLRSLCGKKLGQKAFDNIKQEDKLAKSIVNSEDKNSSPQKQTNKKKEISSSQINRDSNSPDKFNDKAQSVAEDDRQQKREIQILVQPSFQQYYKRASEDYKAFIKYTCPKNFMLLKHFMFAVVFKKVRKMEIKFPPHIFCEFFSLVKQILAAETYEPALEPIIKNEQSAIQNGWAPPIHIGKVPSGFEKDKRTAAYPLLIQPGVGIKLQLLERRKDELVKKISELSFFKRFPAQTIVNFLPYLELRYIEKSELLFAQKGEVYIITGGHLTVFDHSKQFNEPDIVAYYSEGDIIGCDDKDNKISFHPDIWFLSLTRVEYVAINEIDFIDLWNLQNDIHHKSILSFIKQIDIFERVSQLTLYRLAFELLKEKIFSNKDIVFNDGESVHKYHYIELFKEDPKALKNLKNRIFNKIDILPHTQLQIQGFFLVQEGNLELKTYNDWQHYVLRPYNFVGENLLFPSLSISRFGQIVCSSQSAKCLFLSRYDFHKICSIDKEVMKSNVQKSDYFANCQRILYKYYKHHKIEDFDQNNINGQISSSINTNNNNNNSANANNFQI